MSPSNRCEHVPVNLGQSTEYVHRRRVCFHTFQINLFLCNRRIMFNQYQGSISHYVTSLHCLESFKEHLKVVFLFIHHHYECNLMTILFYIMYTLYI